MNEYNILILDDEVEIVELIEIYLKKEGYHVFKAFNGLDGMKLLEKQQFHLVVLDIMMPGLDGLQVCLRIRETMNIPIIMLSAKSQDIDKILGLGLGADDYMTKPFNPMELIARIQSQLRRFIYLNNNQPALLTDQCIEVKGIAINKDNHLVTVYGKEVSLTPTEYEILLLLSEHRGYIFSSEEIFEKVWKEKCYEANNTVMVHIWRLREKIEENPKDPKLIETVWGVGYKLED